MKTIRLHLQALPLNTPPAAPLFLAGNFNDWQPADPRYQFQANGDGSMQLHLETAAELLEYKITRGHWAAAEGDLRGRARTNRVFKPGKAENEVWLRVETWTDIPALTGPENIMLLHPAFFSPELGRHRRIWACLPADYWTNRQQRYPVVYMQDGQNLFDNPEASFGSWGIDKALNCLFMQSAEADAGALQPILIGIEHGGTHRIDEYSPWKNDAYGGGQGEAYLDFLCHTLKPFVDTHLRTLPEREHTGIVGSSMGGLMTLYAALERPQCFGMAGVFSPSLWFSNEIFRLAASRRPKLPVRILLMAGQQESATMVSDMLDLYENLLQAGHADENLHYDLHSDGVHAEWFWAREFEHALRWLFGEMPGHSHGVNVGQIRFRIDKPARHLVVQVDPALREPVLEVRDYCHDRQFRHNLNAENNLIPYVEWEECLYAIRLLAGGDLVFSRRVHLNQVEAVETPGASAILQPEPQHSH